jgi:hypothetical protein
MGVVWRIPVLSLVLLLVAGAAFGEQTGCVLPSQRTMVVAELFFGRAVPGRRPVSNAEWSGFVAHVIARHFPDGFTVHDGSGSWRDPATHKIASERTKILTVAVDPASDPGPRLQAVMDAYRKQFRQSSFGVITTNACGAF